MKIERIKIEQEYETDSKLWKKSPILKTDYLNADLQAKKGEFKAPI